MADIIRAGWHMSDITLLDGMRLNAYAVNDLVFVIFI